MCLYIYTNITNSDDTSLDGYQTTTITDYKTNTKKEISTKIKVPGDINGTYYLKIIPINVCDISSQCQNSSYVFGKYEINNKPKLPTIYNPSGGNWTNQNITLTVSTTTPAEQLGYWYYSYDNTNFTRYDKDEYDSYGLSTFNTSPYSAERNQLAYIRVCNKSASSATDTNNCSDSASTYIRIDKSMYTPALQSITGHSWCECDWNDGKTNVDRECHINVSVHNLGWWGFETTEYDNYVGYQSWGAWFKGNGCSYKGGNRWEEWHWDSDGLFSVDGCASEYYVVKNKDKLGNESHELRLHITIIY